jgi:hypothetical protein
MKRVQALVELGARLAELSGTLEQTLSDVESRYGKLRTLSDLYSSGFLLYGFALWWSIFLASFLVYSVVPVSRTFRTCLSFSQKVEWISRVVSNVNAVIMVVVSSGLLQQTFWSLIQGKVLGHALPHEASFYISQALLLSYFCYDAVLILLFMRSISSPCSSLAHHLFSALSIMFCFYIGEKQPLALIWATGIALTEVSTPLVNARWFLSFRYRERWQYKVIGLGMLVAFVLGRVIYIPVLVAGIVLAAPMYLNPGEALCAFWLGLVGSASSVTIWILNVYWTMLMLRGAWKLFKSQARNSMTEQAAMYSAIRGRPPALGDNENTHLKTV